MRLFPKLFPNKRNFIALVLSTSAIKLRLLPPNIFDIPPNCTPNFIHRQTLKKNSKSKLRSWTKKSATRSEIEYNLVVQKYLSLNFFSRKLKKKLPEKLQPWTKKNRRKVLYVPVPCTYRYGIRYCM